MTLVLVMKALSDETRLRILNLLNNRELCVCDLVSALEITQTKASRHLQYLKHAGLITDRKEAQWVYYSMINREKYPFLDILLRDSVKNDEPYVSDEKSLAKWLLRKDLDCQ